MSDAEFLAGRSSGKESDKVNWINKAEWEFFRQWRKDAEVRMAKRMWEFNKEHGLDKLYEQEDE